MLKINVFLTSQCYFIRLDGVLSTVKALLHVILTSSDSSDVMTVSYQLFVEIPSQVPYEVSCTSIVILSFHEFSISEYFASS